jgi:hypothetical protein
MPRPRDRKALDLGARAEGDALKMPGLRHDDEGYPVPQRTSAACRSNWRLRLRVALLANNQHQAPQRADNPGQETAANP